MNRIFAAVAISAMALSGAAFAADAPATGKVAPKTIQNAQAPATTAVTPSKPAVEDHAKKGEVKKVEKKAGSETAPAVTGTGATGGATGSAKPATR